MWECGSETQGRMKAMSVKQGSENKYKKIILFVLFSLCSILKKAQVLVICGIAMVPSPPYFQFCSLFLSHFEIFFLLAV